METTIYLVRHAESPFVFGEERTRGLSEEGMAAAQRVAEILAGEEIHAIVSSSYVRAIQTVQFLAGKKGLKIEEYDELRERAIKGLDYKISEKELVQAIEQSFTDHEFALEGGESTGQAQQRAIPVINVLLQKYRGRSLAIGTHGNIMTAILSYYDKSYGFDFWKSTSKPDIYKLIFHEDRLQSVERMWSEPEELH
ncbi:histidine phosphatase family protein [Paenibacillus tarimensis]